MKQLALHDLEAVYDSLAEAVTAAGADKEALFLTKLVLLLANASGDWAQVEQTIAEALCNL